MSEDFIRTYDKVLTRQLYDNVVSICDEKKAFEIPRSVNRKQEHVNDMQLLLEPIYPEVARQITELVMHRMVIPYFAEFPASRMEGKWTSGSTLYQKTEPTGGYHVLHAEATGWYNSTRVLAWMIYLNDLLDEDDGGETEFLYQSRRVKPKKNLGVVWPGGITHMHRGNPPLKKTKKILTGWVTPCGDMHLYEPNFISAEQDNMQIKQDGKPYKR